MRTKGIKSARNKMYRMLDKEVRLSPASGNLIDRALRFFLKYYEGLTDEELESLGFSTHQVLFQYTQIKTKPKDS